jgi:hypothetical protein
MRQVAVLASLFAQRADVFPEISRIRLLGGKFGL